VSKKKQVIHVKDLVIKADNVTIQPTRHGGHHRRTRDPFFGIPLNHKEHDKGREE